MNDTMLFVLTDYVETPEWDPTDFLFDRSWSREWEVGFIFFGVNLSRSSLVTEGPWSSSVSFKGGRVSKGPHSVDRKHLVESFLDHRCEM